MFEMHNNITMKHLGEKTWKQNPHKLNQCTCIKKIFMMAKCKWIIIAHAITFCITKNKTLKRKKKYWNVDGSKDDKLEYNGQHSLSIISFLTLFEIKCIPRLYESSFEQYNHAPKGNLQAKR
jgi:hypothetical protein